MKTKFTFTFIKINWFFHAHNFRERILENKIDFFPSIGIRFDENTEWNTQNGTDFERNSLKYHRNGWTQSFSLFEKK